MIDHNSLKIAIAALACVLFTQSGFAQSAKPAYQTPKPFTDLYYDFTGATDPAYPKGKVNISQMLYQAEMSKNAALANQSGPLVMLIDSTLYVYDANGKRQLSVLMRTAPDSGFTEMTVLSHIGPALAYLAKEKEYGGTQWKTGLEMLLKDIKAIREVNAAKENNWLDQVNAPAWSTHKEAIHNMVDYTCYMAGSYISDLLSGKKILSSANVQKDFYEKNSDYLIPYNDVMVATFMLTAYQSMASVHDQLTTLNIDWKNAKVLVRFVAGSNVTAGVSAESNWLVPFVKALSNNQLPDDRVYIAPYLDVKPSLGKTQLTKEDYQYYNYRFLSTYNRTHVAKDVFSEIPDIKLPANDKLPGNYGVTKAADVGDFIVRLKYSLAQPTEMLSNTVGFWMAGELAAKQWQLDKVDLPGLTVGLPKGVSTYPAKNPEIPS